VGAAIAITTYVTKEILRTHMEGTIQSLERWQQETRLGARLDQIEPNLRDELSRGTDSKKRFAGQRATLFLKEGQYPPGRGACVEWSGQLPGGRLGNRNQPSSSRDFLILAPKHCQHQSHAKPNTDIGESSKRNVPRRPRPRYEQDNPERNARKSVGAPITVRYCSEKAQNKNAGAEDQHAGRHECSNDGPDRCAKQRSHEALSRNGERSTE
jgi:hypothetical protein